MSEHSQTLVFRVDAGTSMGTGHVMRCLALAQAWRDQGNRGVFAMSSSTPAVDERLLLEGMDVMKVNASTGSEEVAAELIQFARNEGANWVVSDGYAFCAEYQRCLKRAGVRHLLVDDLGRIGGYYADIVLDQNASASESLYRDRQTNTRLLLGSCYILLRREFACWREWKREISANARRILVTMGGTDPDNLTEYAIRALATAAPRNLEVVVVTTTSCPHRRAIESAGAAFPGKLKVLQNTTNMPELMAWADLAIIAAGGTLWELLYMGCPAISFARNGTQREVITQLHQQGIVETVERGQASEGAFLASTVYELLNSAERRRRMNAMGRERIDGRGAQRVCEFLRG